jgi:hypothetical protein
MFWVMVAGYCASSFATDARVLTMGRHDDFFMDDVSIFRNPANINYYPNMIMGSLGVYGQDTTGSKQPYSALIQQNKDPQRPFGGVILSYSLNQSSEAGNQYPLISFGAIFNRYDYMLDYLNPGSTPFQNAIGSNFNLAAPVGKIDLMLGYAMPNGAMIGVGGYLAFQNETDTIYNANMESNLYKGNVGINWPLAKSMNLEVSLDVSSIRGKGIVYSNSADTGGLPQTIADGDMSFKGDVRLFSALSSFNGDFVPHIGIEKINLMKGKYDQLDVSGGLGVNINIDKGFFWTAIEGLYESTDKNYLPTTTSTSGIGGRISAGLERNVIWDWWVWRIGVMKRLLYVTDGAGNNGRWEQNPEADASDDDFAAIGWGLNIENRLKVDIVLSENMWYTLTNLVSGSSKYLLNRATITYSF